MRMAQSAPNGIRYYAGGILGWVGIQRVLNNL